MPLIPTYDTRNPQIDDLVSQVARYRADLQWIFDELDDGDGAYPGHSHRTPGRWDSDGRICISCRRWNIIKARAFPQRDGPGMPNDPCKNTAP